MKELVYNRLRELGIPFEVTDHAPVYTMEDTNQQGLEAMGTVCKNLFIRDAKGKRHFLVVTLERTPVDLRSLGEMLAAGRLSFASEQRLQTYLGAAPGAVSPLDILWDREHAVTVVLDEALRGVERLGMHPNDNSATVWLRWEGLWKFLESAGNPLMTLKL